jgi:hypothetical protein
MWSENKQNRPVPDEQWGVEVGRESPKKAFEVAWVLNTGRKELWWLAGSVEDVELSVDDPDGKYSFRSVENHEAVEVG